MKTVVIQACIVTVWDAVLCGSIALSGGSSSSVGYLTAIGLTVVIYLVGYVLFFLGYFYLIFKKKDLPRSFQLPGGTPFKAIVAGAGLFMTVATLIISFFPSSNLDAQSNMVYQATLGIAFVISVAIPFVIYALRHRWAPQGPTDRAAVGATAGTGVGAAAGTHAAGAHVGKGAPMGTAARAVPLGPNARKTAHPSDPATADPKKGAAPMTKSSTLGNSGPINKRTRASENLRGGKPSGAGAAGMSAGGGPGSDFGATVARGISAAVVSVTSRPSAPWRSIPAPRSPRTTCRPSLSPSCATRWRCARSISTRAWAPTMRRPRAG